jgi:hypothetical protein
MDGVAEWTGLLLQRTELAARGLRGQCARVRIPTCKPMHLGGEESEGLVRTERQMWLA